MRKLKVSRQAEIVDAALDIAAEQGIDAVSMRAIAARIGLTSMALYGYFRSKDELFDAIVGRLLSEASQPTCTLDWRETIRQLAIRVRSTARRHPSAFKLLFSRPAVNPSAVTIVDVLFEALLRSGLDPAQVPRLERMISTFLIGYALSEVGGRFAEGSLDTRSRRAQLRPAQLPGHRKLAEHLDSPVDWDAEYRIDLEDLLETVARLAVRNAGPHTSPTGPRP